MKRATSTVFFAVFASLALGSSSRAAEPALEEAAFEVDFTDCSEFVGLTSVPFEEARARVPAEFTLVGEEFGQALLAVRASHCEAVSVEGSAPGPGTLAQIGISVVPPNGGDANTYQLWYVTDIPLLAARLLAAGLPAQHVHNLSYTVTDDGTGAGGLLEVLVPLPASPQFTLLGTVTHPPAGAPDIAFLANWFSGGLHGDVLMQTTFPNIQFGGGDVTLTTPTDSPLAELLGVPTTGFFVEFRATFPSAHMKVFVTPE